MKKYRTEAVEEMFRKDYLSLQASLAELFKKIEDEYLNGNQYYNYCIDKIKNLLDELGETL